MGFEEILGLIIAIVMVILFFFMILPQIATALGQSSAFIFIIGGILLVGFIIAIFAIIARGGSSSGRGR
jgi:hypothetical protein